MQQTVTIAGRPVRFNYHETKRSVMWSNNWQAIVEASYDSGDPRFIRRSDGPGTYGSTTILFNPIAKEESSEVSAR